MRLPGGQTSTYQVAGGAGDHAGRKSRQYRPLHGGIVAKKREPLFDAEHFFDGHKADPDYALSCLRTAYEAGAKWLVLSTPMAAACRKKFYRIVSEVKAKLPGAAWACHAITIPNKAVAVSCGGPRRGTPDSGHLERAGRTLRTPISVPAAKSDAEGAFASQFETGLKKGNLAQLTHVSRLLDEISIVP